MPFPTVAKPGVKSPQKATTDICTYFYAPHGGHTIQPNILYDTTPFSVQQNGSAKLLRCSGFPIIVNERNEYELVSNYGVPKMDLTDVERQALVERLEQEDHQDEHLRSALDKLKMNLP